MPQRFAEPVDDEVSKVVSVSILKAVAKWMVIGYFFYVVASGVLPFAVYHRSAENYLQSTDVQRFFGAGRGNDWVAMVEQGEAALQARYSLLTAAEESIFVAYHTLHAGWKAETFFAALLEAADRGVEVEILMDGMLHRLFGSLRNVRYVLQLHPNIEYKFYEPVHMLTPWRWNNRLHDKLLIIDGRSAMISGRNIGDRYYLPEHMTGETTLDRDFFIVNENASEDQDSAVQQIQRYFAAIWDHPFSQSTDLRLTAGRREAAAQTREQLAAVLAAARKDHPQYFSDGFPWDDYLLPTNKVTLIHNPIQRWNKEPWVLAELGRLASMAETSVWVQSPYIIPTDPMLDWIDSGSLKNVDLQLFTNSVAVSPNMPAIAGYMRKRPAIKDVAAQLWEYHGASSLHGKAIVVDDHLSAVGSFNIDSRSSFLSTETMLVIHGEEFNRALRQSLQDIAADSRAKLPGFDGEQPPPQHLSLGKAAAVAVLQRLSFLWDYFL